MSDMDRGLSDEWSDWFPGGITTSIEGDVMLETTIGLDGVSRHRHRWRRYRHESAMLALLRTGGIACLIVTKEGPVRPKEGA